MRTMLLILTALALAPTALACEPPEPECVRAHAQPTYPGGVEARAEIDRYGQGSAAVRAHAVEARANQSCPLPLVWHQ